MSKKFSQQILLIDKNGDLEETSMKNISSKDEILSNLYKKCGFKTDKDFIQQYIINIITKTNNKYTIYLFGKDVGRSNYLNTYVFPTPMCKKLYSTCALVAFNTDTNDAINLTKSLWDEIKENISATDSNIHINDNNIFIDFKKTIVAENNTSTSLKNDNTLKYEKVSNTLNILDNKSALLQSSITSSTTITNIKKKVSVDDNDVLSDSGDEDNEDSDNELSDNDNENDDNDEDDNNEGVSAIVEDSNIFMDLVMDYINSKINYEEEFDITNELVEEEYLPYV